MPTLNVVYWNIEDLGLLSAPYRAVTSVRSAYIAAVCGLLQADVLLVEELRSDGADQVLYSLLTWLNQLPPPLNNWRVELIKGALAAGSAPPYARFEDLDWSPGRHEGYAVFWNQNIAKFRVNTAPPLGGNPNQQSFGSWACETRNWGPGGGPIVLPIRTPLGGIAVPAASHFVLPAGTQEPDHAPIGAQTPVAPGTLLPNGTHIGPAGVSIAYGSTADQSRVVIPGNYTLNANFYLPPVGAHLEPNHSLSLVLDGRNTMGSTLNGNVAAPPFKPGGGNKWTYLNFTRSAQHHASLKQTRRPAWLTIDVTGVATRADALIPLVVYHAPLAAPANASGMQRAAYARPMYQVYDPATANWINGNRAVCGGDFNVRLEQVAYAYNAFFHAFDNRGAGCQARVYAPPVGGHRYNNVLNKSCVQLVESPWGDRTRIDSADPDAYRRAAIDNIFYRGFTAAQAPAAGAGVVNQLEPLLADPPAPLRQVIEAHLNLPAFDAYWKAAWGLRHGALPPMPSMMAPQDSVWDLSIGEFTAGGAGANPSNARRAAEFIHLCISDHQPVVFKMVL